jgi:hypothetical protein
MNWKPRKIVRYPQIDGGQWASDSDCARGARRPSQVSNIVPQDCRRSRAAPQPQEFAPREPIPKGKIPRNNGTVRLVVSDLGDVGLTAIAVSAAIVHGA